MKHYLPISILFCSSLLYSCKEDNLLNQDICENYIPTETFVTNAVGRIYYRKTSYGNFYYFGNPDINKREGLHVPCNLPKEFIPEGDIGEVVKYSGEIKIEEGSDPFWLGLDLTFIERVDYADSSFVNKIKQQNSN